MPWFFMLSGFVLTHARLKSKNPSRKESVVVFIQKRVRRSLPPHGPGFVSCLTVACFGGWGGQTAVIYPAYALGVLLAFLVDWWRDKPLPPWYVAAAQGLLAQAWLPWFPEKAVQLHCWFLSAMVPYWALFDVTLQGLVLRVTRLSTCCLLLLLFSLPPWAAYVAPSQIGGRSDWYSTHKTAVLEDEVDYVPVLLKFHPVFYFHVFVFGMLLARARYIVEVEVVKRAVKHGVPLNVQQNSSLEAMARNRKLSVFAKGARRLSKAIGVVGIVERIERHRSARMKDPISTARAKAASKDKLQARLAVGLAGLFRFGTTLGYIGLLLVFNLHELKVSSALAILDQPKTDAGLRLRLTRTAHCLVSRPRGKSRQDSPC